MSFKGVKEKADKIKSEYPNLKDEEVFRFMLLQVLMEIKTRLSR